jgi:hypothetical protein
VYSVVTGLGCYTRARPVPIIFYMCVYFEALLWLGDGHLCRILTDFLLRRSLNRPNVVPLCILLINSAALIRAVRGLEIEGSCYSFVSQ